MVGAVIMVAAIMALVATAEAVITVVGTVVEVGVAVGITVAVTTAAATAAPEPGAMEATTLIAPAAPATGRSTPRARRALMVPPGIRLNLASGFLQDTPPRQTGTSPARASITNRVGERETTHIGLLSSGRRSDGVYVAEFVRILTRPPQL